MKGKQDCTFQRTEVQNLRPSTYLYWQLSFDRYFRRPTIILHMRYTATLPLSKPVQPHNFNMSEMAVFVAIHLTRILLDHLPRFYKQFLQTYYVNKDSSLSLGMGCSPSF